MLRKTSMILEENKNKDKDKQSKLTLKKLALKKLAFICEKTSITLKKDYKLSLVTY